MTLTTEQLRARAAHLRAKAEQWRGHGYVGKAARLDGDADALDELAANREAAPAAEPYMYELWKWDETVPELDRWFLIERSREKLVAGKWQKIVRLYTAPPAPAVPEDVRQALRDMDDEIVAELDTEETACRASSAGSTCK
ncbi:Uncharacterised protein [Serratia ficaria]|uniref:hypothetical protein n=1 Tax=Serratia ficaria TaxID=61651 RepID=UPI002176FE6C|nr:hypothetical protein [Serratia ficaria]CAI2080511.1 Uncharacterised protein [Serratia ficaria]CAI2490028.1 Uncharacterised protein [Serratia ficaria]